MFLIEPDKLISAKDTEMVFYLSCIMRFYGVKSAILFELAEVSNVL